MNQTTALHLLVQNSLIDTAWASHGSSLCYAIIASGITISERHPSKNACPYFFFLYFHWILSYARPCIPRGNNIALWTLLLSTRLIGSAITLNAIHVLRTIAMPMATSGSSF